MRPAERTAGSLSWPESEETPFKLHRSGLSDTIVVHLCRRWNRPTRPSVERDKPYRVGSRYLYSWGMEVAVTELRAHLSEWLSMVRDGGEVVVTERGVPVARLSAVGSSSLLERLIEEGLVARPQSAGRPKASGRSRPSSRRSVADIVSESRR